MWQDTAYRVVHLDFSGIASAVHDKFRMAFAETLITEFDTNNSVIVVNDFGVRDPARILTDIAKNLEDNSIVLLIDEYDAPFTRHIHEPEILNEMISIFLDFYSTLKQYTDKFRFIFITGITRKYYVPIFSAFNNSIDISLKKEFNSLLGFTKRDLELYFDAYIENVSTILNISKENLYQRLEQYYAGYQFAVDANETIYNTWSILNFFKFPEDGFKNYWFDSGGISSIIINYLKIKDSFDFIDYKNRNIYIAAEDISDISEIYGRDTLSDEVLLYQLGYFTIRNNQYSNIKLVIPNAEVENSLLRLYFTTNRLKPR